MHIHDRERRTSPGRSRSTARSSRSRTSTRRSAAARRSSPSAPNTAANEVERTNLYNTLRFGALPLSAHRAGSARRSIRRSAPTSWPRRSLAGAVGLALVLFFMIAYYRLPGVLAALALVFYTLVVYAIFRIIHVTLTLAGVAAFILSHRHGGGRQHPHLRAHEGGDPRRQDARPGHRGRLQPGLVEHPRLERRLAPRRRLAVLAGHDGRPWVRARAHHRRAGQHVQRGHRDAHDAALRHPDDLGTAASSSTTWSADRCTTSSASATCGSRSARS